MATDEPRIVERDGEVVRIVAGAVEVIAAMSRVGDDLVLERVSIDGAGPRTLGLATVRALARQLGRSEGARRVLVRGTTRTTGANPGKVPRDIVIIV